MSDDDQMTDAELDVVRRSAPKKCPSCKSKSDFVPGEHLYALTAVNRTGYDVSQRFPLALLVCEACGHVVFRSAVALGLMSPEIAALGAKRSR